MPTSLRSMLIAVSVISLLYVIRKIRRAQVKLSSCIIWVFVSVFFIVISIFPEIVYSFCELLGIVSPTNLVYLVVIFYLLFMLFMSSLRISSLETRLDSLAQEVALRDRSFLGLETSDDIIKEQQKGDPDK